MGSGGQKARPMMDANGNFVMRFLDRDSPITLFEPTNRFTGRTFKTTGIATEADGFSNRGLSPGISDDGNFIVFAAENPNLGQKKLIAFLG